MKKNIIYIISLVVISISLIISFCDNSPEYDNDIVEQNPEIITEDVVIGMTEVEIKDLILVEPEVEANDKIVDETIVESKIDKPIESDQKEQEILSQTENIENNVTITITCHTIFDNMDKFAENKVSLLPVNGIILPTTEVVIIDGDSVFDVLSKITKDKKMHFEFVNTPIYGSAYIEGINNIYEFDCGDLSGWMFKVNGYFPGNGITNYILNKNDVIEIIYTCDLGNDIR